ncbi:hypothetical protein PV797_09435 [Clostridiaceae bacterium M8S5]|nr:hypothetical protein PV797_09435 [Clostridiaceae bacterium M8S5]
MKTLKKTPTQQSTLLVNLSCNCHCTDGYKDFKNDQIHVYMG